MAINWRAIQATGCKKPETFNPPRDVKPRYMSMGSWHGDLMKGGAMRNPRRNKSDYKGA